MLVNDYHHSFFHRPFQLYRRVYYHSMSQGVYRFVIPDFVAHSWLLTGFHSFFSNLVRPHLPLGLKLYSSALTIDIHWAVIFTLTVRKSYKSCALPHLMSIGEILTGSYLVATVKLKGATTIIEVLTRDGQYFSTASHQVLVLNTFDSQGILYYVGEKSRLTSSSWFLHSNHSQSSHRLFVSRAFLLSFLGANI